MKDLTVTVVSATADRDVHLEGRFKYLQQKGFVRGVTELDQWFILVCDAWKESRMPMNETMRDYLVVMLNRFTKRVDLIEQLSAFDYASYLLGSRKIDSVCTQDVADMSLQYVAFFAERSAYRHEPRSLSYTASIGETLYHRLSREAEGKDDWFSHAFSQMGHAFGRAVMVLRAINPGFRYQRAITEEGKRRQDLSFPTDVEAARVRQIDAMYLEQPFSSGRKDN